MGRKRIFYFVCHRALVTSEELAGNPLAGTYYVDDAPIMGNDRAICGSADKGIGLLKKLIDPKRDTQLRFSHDFPEQLFPRIKNVFREYGKLEYADEKGNPISLE
jgi:hypothetical protein